ncbi:hypothetical protein M0813_10205 [Anaeramoeba flamelloides]|uniref:DDE Tnp4 domain-containing protein n=1 Tax=Anaeramoeba flamelloides TaxID=1746091 RepID=A0ABQ8X329_9EUKA|nr:hypothetical protein M0813_10205 [Anaeramoeba flamelloides]
MEFDEEITQMYENLNEMGEEQILQIRQRIRNQDEEEEIEENRITILKCQRLNKYILFHNICRFTFDQFDDIWNQLKDHMPESRYKGRRYKLLTKKDHLFMLITYLSHGCSYKALEKQFGMDKSWICRLIHRLLLHLHPFFEKQFITPVDFDYEKNMHTCPDFPDVVGAIDVTTIKIEKPSRNWKEYYSYKHSYHCFKAQLFVTLRGRVIDIVSGIKGAVHDITIAKQSKLEQMVKTNDPNFSYGFLCDRGYVGLQHKIPSAVICKKKPRGRQLSEEDQLFNKKLSYHRQIVENFFGRLKSKYQILNKLYRYDHKYFVPMFNICCALTNKNFEYQP